LKSIPIRIHINGTRGKSSVTRLIGAGLRAGGYNTITKVTGTFPRMILNDGTEVAVHRKEKANILEQLDVVKYCSNKKADVLLIECMALQPNYQRITEHKMIKATHGVITNIRMDHLDVMGPKLENVAEALSMTIPKNSKLFTAETRMLEFLKDKARRLGTEVISTTGDTVNLTEMAEFPYFEQPENVSLALAVCDSLDVNRKEALDAMKTTKPDEGALKKYTLRKKIKVIHFYNALAANDPESSITLWNNIQKIEAKDSQKAIILNSRKDRRERSEQLILAISSLEYDVLFLTGENVDLVKSMAKKKGIPSDKLAPIGQPNPEQQLSEMLTSLGQESVLVAFGNMGAGGAELVKYFKQNSESKM
jgi:poly-gamma-glutamate synthase PgsB/CapB